MGYVNYGVLQWIDNFRVACKMAGCENRSAKQSLSYSSATPFLLDEIKWSVNGRLLFCCCSLGEYLLNRVVLVMPMIVFELTFGRK